MGWPSKCCCIRRDEREAMACRGLPRFNTRRSGRNEPGRHAWTKMMGRTAIGPGAHIGDNGASASVVALGS